MAMISFGFNESASKAAYAMPAVNTAAETPATPRNFMAPSLFTRGEQNTTDTTIKCNLGFRPLKQRYF